MRLLCPNCDAEYEVEASVIPANGRDVQCSNCGHAWYQLPPEIEADREAEAALHDAPLPAPMPSAAGAGPISTVIDELPRRGLDESVLAVLREEAERETAARFNEKPQGVETQIDMGLQPAEYGGAYGGAAAQRIARLKGVDATPTAPFKPQTRREMLPEIEEINSSLRASSEKRGGAAAAVAETMMPPARKTKGFRNGFVVMLLLGAALAAVYLMAPKIAQQIPGAAAGMQAYVASVDAVRVMLDGILQSAIGWLRGAAA